MAVVAVVAVLAGTTPWMMNEELVQVNAFDDQGYFARFGAPQPQRRGEHAGVDLGMRRISTNEVM